jgi:hypothetical protein
MRSLVQRAPLRFPFALGVALAAFGCSERADAQDWVLVQSKSGAYLDVEAANPAAGTRTQTWELVGGDNQLWRATNEVLSGATRLQSKLGRYLDVEWGNAQTGTPVHIWDWNGGAAQAWFVSGSREPGYFLLRSSLGTYLDSLWGGSRNGVPIWMWERTDAPSQQWRFLSLARPLPRSVGSKCPIQFRSGYRYTRDFNGPPTIRVSTELRTSDDRRSLIARTHLHVFRDALGWGAFGESRDVDISVHGEWDDVIYTAPSNRRIVDIAPSHRRSAATWQGAAAGAEFDVCSDGAVETRSPAQPGLVSRFRVIGDTGGDDISDDDNCRCDTRLEGVDFNPIPIALL